MFVGYARVSTRDQSPTLQLDALAARAARAPSWRRCRAWRATVPSSPPPWTTSGPATRWWCGSWIGWPARCASWWRTAEDLQRREIGLKVLTQQIDTTTPGGRLVFHVFAAMAEFERELTLERTHAGLVAAKALGRRGGRKPAMGPAEIKRAKAMLADPTITVEEVAHQIGVQASTLYRHIPGGRSSLADA